MTVKELMNTKVTLTTIINNVSIGNTNNNPFAISNIRTTTKGKPFKWNAFVDIIVPENTTLFS